MLPPPTPRQPDEGHLYRHGWVFANDDVGFVPVPHHQPSGDFNVIRALNELVVDLTKHADALRESVTELIDSDCELMFAIPRAQDAIDAYDNFIKEA